jgi:hypothetical protein
MTAHRTSESECVVMQGSVPIGDVVVRGHGGPTRAGDLAYARRKVASVMRLAPRPVLTATVDVVVQEDRARERPIAAKAELDVDGQFARARVWNDHVGSSRLARGEIARTDGPHGAPSVLDAGSES